MRKMISIDGHRRIWPPPTPDGFTRVGSVVRGDPVMHWVLIPNIDAPLMQYDRFLHGRVFLRETFDVINGEPIYRRVDPNDVDEPDDEVTPA